MHDLLPLLVVIMSTFLFLMVATDSIISYTRYREEKDFENEVESFYDSILSFDPILFKSTYGKLDASKLNSGTSGDFQKHFDPDAMGFHYNITLIDVSLYPDKFSWFAGESHERMGFSLSNSIPAIVVSQNNEAHSVILKVIVWR